MKNYKKTIVKGILFILIMLIVQIVILFIAGGMFMDGTESYQKQGNNLIIFFKYVLGFPLYPIINFDYLLNSRKFELNFFLIFLLNSIIQFGLLHFIKKAVIKNHSK